MAYQTHFIAEKVEAQRVLPKVTEAGSSLAVLPVTLNFILSFLIN